ncbi:hypothetical protein [Pinisolibacter sp.]
MIATLGEDDWRAVLLEGPRGVVEDQIIAPHGSAAGQRRSVTEGSK